MIDTAYVVALGTITVSGLVGFGRLQERTKNLQQDVNQKADKDVLVQIDKRLERIEQHVLKLVNGNSSGG